MAEVVLDAVSTPTKVSGSQGSTSWSHSASGSDRLVLVAISWWEPLGSDTLDSVTYGGTAMTQIASTSFGAVFSLANPATGSKTVVVNWSAASPKGALAASVSFTGVSQDGPVVVTTATGTSTSPAVATPLRLPWKIFGLLSVNAASSLVTATLGSGLTQKWNDNAGSGSTLVQGAAATRDTDASEHSMAWTLSSSRSWSAIAVCIQPKAQKISSALAGGLTSVNANDYDDLQAAADDVCVGGRLLIPAGDHSVPSGGLVIRKPMHVAGHPGTRLFSHSAAANEPVIKIEPGGAQLENITISDLTLLNATPAASPISGNFGVQCDIPADGSKVSFLTLERVIIAGMGDDGLHLHALGGVEDSFFVFVSLREVRSIGNRGRGMFASFANQANFNACYFLGNDLAGIQAATSEVVFYACGFENNCLSDDEERIDSYFGGQVYLQTATLSRFDGCHFEEFGGEAHPVNKRGLMIENSPCCQVGGCTFGNATEDEDSVGITCTFGAGIPVLERTPGVIACSIFPNRFSKVHTAIEIDSAEDSAAQDCVIFPQRIEPLTTGEINIPSGLSDSGTVALGNRRARVVVGEVETVHEVARGILVPNRHNIPAVDEEHPGDPLPALTGDDAGYILFDTTNGTLVVWDGSIWLSVNVTP